MADGLMIFVKGGAAAPAPAGIPHIEATADDYIGGWICVEMPSMQLLLLDGEANLIDGDELYTTTWTVTDGVAEFDGMKLYTQEDWSGILDMGDGTLLTFERGYVEKPEASTNEPDDPEYAAMPVGPEGEPFFGVWNLESMAGMNPADFGMSMTLTFNEDGTCVLFDGYEGETGFWWVSDGAAVVMGDALTLNDEGKLVMSADGMDMIFAKEGEEPAAPADPEPAADSSAYLGYWKLETMMGMDAALMGVSMTLTLNEDGTCTLETDGEVSDGIWSMEGGKVVIDGEYLTLTADGKLDMSDGMMIFVKSETAHATAVPTEAPTAEPANNNAEYIGKKYVCTTYTTAGYTMDASMLGAEYSVLFKADHTCDFTMAGFTLNSLPYTVTAEGVYAINYYGSMFNCVPTSTGFDMDYYGTMLMHFVPAE